MLLGSLNPDHRARQSSARLTPWKRIAPIFAVHDLDAAMEHYQRRGFAVRPYAGGGYGFATWHGIEIHLGVVPDDDHRTSAAYLFVDDPDGNVIRFGSPIG